MTGARPQYTGDVPDDVTARVRERCVELPEVHEEPAWVGTRWKVRNRTFAHVLGVVFDEAAPLVMLTFRAEGEDLDMLRHAGHPFFVLGWGRDALGLVIDADTDWAEVRELITDSYCVLAPKKLVALVDRPVGADSPPAD
ncbi:MAG: MmcQ/YjbR family DNA-binding protein [Acidimicrobiales bacterium]|nr:MmcQ/YjbR family DNA-binding protein [Acidimicrobiales bacterium]